MHVCADSAHLLLITCHQVLPCLPPESQAQAPQSLTLDVGHEQPIVLLDVMHGDPHDPPARLGPCQSDCDGGIRLPPMVYRKLEGDIWRPAHLMQASAAFLGDPRERNE